MKKSEKNSPGVTLRSVVIGLLLIPPNCYWVIQSEAVWGTTYLTVVSLFFNVTFTLLVLVGLNALCKRMIPKAALKQGELLTVYIMLCMGSSLAGNNFLENLVLSLGHGFWFATPENEWSELFFRYVPDWMAVKDKAALRGFYEGDSSLYISENIAAWLKPLALWASFSVVLVFVLLCFTVIVRKHWIETEKLSYPIIQLPLELTRNGTGSRLFRNRLFLLGFGLTALITLINGLHFHYPAVPNLRMRAVMDHLFTEKPWSAVGRMRVVIYPWIVGLVFFIPLDLSLSVWFFYLFTKVQSIAASIFGLRSLPGFPYFNQQTTGAWLGLFIIALWLTRKHLRSVFTRAFRPGVKPSAGSGVPKEPMSYRTAITGFVLGLALLVVFCMAGGMPFWIAFSFICLVIGLETTISRIRAELGPPMHELGWVGPDTILVTALGPRRLGGKTLTMLTFLYFTDRTVSSHPMPHQLEGFKIAERTGINSRRLAAVMILSIVVGIIAALWALLHSAYQRGVDSGFMGYMGIPRESFNRLGHQIRYPAGPNYPELGFIGFGLLLSLATMFLRTRFLWWPLHPVGYALSTSGWIIHYIWFSFLLSWFIKWVILRRWHLKAYRAATPFFFGLILGEYTVGCLWNLLGIIFGFRTYGFFES